MTYRGTYIGDFSYPGFEWEPTEAKYRIGNLPAGVIDGSYEPGQSLCRAIRGPREYRWIDWGAQAGKISKKDIIDAMKSCYGFDIMERNELPQKLDELVKTVKSLPENQEYLIVEWEL